MAAHWKQRRKTRNLSSLWGDIVQRAGDFIGSREAGSRGRGVQQEPTVWTSRAPRRVRSPHLSRSTSVGQRCAHANDMCRRRAATSEASPSAIEPLNTLILKALSPFRAVIPKHAQPRGARASGFLSSRALHCLLRVVGSACVCWMLRPRSYVASCVWRLCRVAHWLSSTMLRACCWMSAARCSPHTKCGDAVCFRLHLANARVLLHVVCCLMHVVCCMCCLVLPSSARCLLHAACYLVSCCLLARCQWSFTNSTLCVACCTLAVACCMLRCTSLLSAACCWKSRACCLLRSACRLLSAAYCPLHAACCLDVVCCILQVVCRIFPCCMSSVTFSPMHVACRRWSVAHFPVLACGIAARWIVSACPFFVACRSFYVAWCLFSVARPSAPCRMVCAVRRLPHLASPQCPLLHAVCAVCRLSRVASRHVACAALRVVGCTLHVPCRMLSHVLSWLLAVPSCMSSAACRRLQRCRVT